MTTIAPPPPPPPLMAALAPQETDPVRPNHTMHQPVNRLARTIRFGAIALGLMGIAAFGIIIVSAYDKAPAPEDVPLVTASETPVRERPVEEGGMQVANRDSTVFNSLSSAPVSPPIEQLRPAPEQPVDLPAPSTAGDVASNMPTPRRPDGSPALTADEIRMMHAERQGQALQSGDAASQAMTQLETAASNLPAGVTDGQTSTVMPERLTPPVPAGATASAPIANAAPAAPSEQEENPASALTTTEGSAATAVAPLTVLDDPAPVSAQDTSAQIASAPVVVPSASAATRAPAQHSAPAIAARTAPANAGVANRMVQLGAVRSEEAAKAEWSRLQARYRAQLGGLSPSIQRVDLGARGIYWRVRGGPVSADAGKKICETLSRSQQNCMVVGR